MFVLNVIILLHLNDSFFECVVVDPLRMFFFGGWVKMGNQATNFCIFVKEKEYLPMKDSNEDIVKWREKK